MGVTLGELKKIIFLIQYEKKLIISGDIRNYIFLTPTVKDHENQGKVHPFFVEYNLILLVFIAFFFKSWFYDTSRGGNLR